MDPMEEAGNMSSTSLLNGEEYIVEEKIGGYKFRLIKELEVMKFRPRDIVTFYVTVTVRLYRMYYSRLRLTKAENLSETSLPISLETLRRQENNLQDFLRSCLRNDPECLGYFDPERVDEMLQRIVSIVENFSSSDLDESADSEIQEFRLIVGIFVDFVEVEESEEEDMMMKMEEEEEDENEKEEEEEEEDMTMKMEEDEDEEEEDDEEDQWEEWEEEEEEIMIPASDEAINSMEKFTHSSVSLQTEECNICMEKFDGEECSSMPCGHVFHYECIFNWLKTSHTCPLCRYPMPTYMDC